MLCYQLLRSYVFYVLIEECFSHGQNNKAWGRLALCIIMLIALTIIYIDGYVNVHFSASVQAAELEIEAYPLLDELTSKISTLNLERVRRLKSRLVALTRRVQKVNFILISIKISCLRSLV
jgi:hypothetical protein